MVEEDINANIVDEISHPRVVLEGERLQLSGYEPKYGYPVYRDSTGRKMYLVCDNPVRQFFTSLLLEKTIRQCPVIYDKTRGNFYSRGEPEGNPAQPSQEARDTAEADMFILAYVFGLGDRGLHVPQNYSLSGGNVWQFDLAGSFEFLLDYAGTVHEKVGDRYNWLSLEQKRLAKEKVQKMLTEFKGAEGREIIRRLYRYALERGREAQQNPLSDYRLQPHHPAPFGKYEMFLRLGTNFNIASKVYTPDDVHAALIRRLESALSL